MAKFPAKSKPKRGGQPERKKHERVLAPAKDVNEAFVLTLTITEYRLTCSCCGTSSCAPLPTGVPEHQSGPRLTACVVLLMAPFRQSERRVGLFCESVLVISCSAGRVVKFQKRTTVAQRSAYDEPARSLPTQDVLGIDESPPQEANHKAWLWTFLGEGFDGIVTCDRARMFWRLPRLQWC